MKRTVFPATLFVCAIFVFVPIVNAGYPNVPEVHHGTYSIDPSIAAASRVPLSKNLDLVSFTPLDGIVSDVWAHGKFAYVAGFGDISPLRILDISDPQNPEVVAALATPAGSSPQDVKVATINTKYFHGDLMAVGNDGGAGPPFGGIQLVDVSDPKSPEILSEPRIGPVHNLYLFQRGNRAYVLLALSFAEVFSKFFPPFIDVADFAVVDVTDPRNPQLLSQPGEPNRAGWFALDAGLPIGAPFFFPPYLCDEETCRGDDFPGAFNHDVWANQSGTIAYASYWDLGLIVLDISDPASPKLIGRGIEPETFGSDEGNLHMAVPARGGNLVLTSDEDFTAGPYGFLRIFDTRDASNPVQIGAYATQNALTAPPSAPPFPIHNIFVQGNRAYISWYFDGIRVVDFSNPYAPREIAAFVPEAGIPNGFFWGVYKHRDLILGTDFSGAFGADGGLYILKLRR